MKKRIIFILMFVIIVGIIYFRPTTEWTQCSKCGVQQIERGIARRVIPSWSVYEFDEFGTYAEWKQLHPGENCSHDFRKVKHKTPATTLKELHQAED
ncbi:hypothetical protein EGM51_06140 [Verrucomicrobia bacterium S94]|nr:hypothetical protein EGM51_06140 [Verrucomicrobia bacterium S94]